MAERLKPLFIGDLEIKIPIIQGGMGVKVSTASLASAVADCGGAGTIASVGLGYGTKENETHFVEASRHGLQHEIREAKKMSNGVIGINAMVALSNYQDLVKTASEEKTDFIISGAGLPLKLPSYVDDKSIKLLPIVSSARAATLIIRTWKKRFNRYPDGIIVEGPLAGGHLGFKPTVLRDNNINSMLEEIVREVIDVAQEYEASEGINLPVIAAGGIFDGKDIARFIKMGTRGVQMATRFAATHECSVADEFKDLYISATNDDLLIIDSPVGMPGRAIKTRFIERVNNGERVNFKCNYRCLKTCNPQTAPYCIARALFDAVSGNVDNAVVFAGSNVTRVNKVVSVKELMEELVEETNYELGKM